MYSTAPTSAFRSYPYTLETFLKAPFDSPPNRLVKMLETRSISSDLQSLFLRRVTLRFRLQAFEPVPGLFLRHHTFPYMLDATLGVDQLSCFAQLKAAIELFAIFRFIYAAVRLFPLCLLGALCGYMMTFQARRVGFLSLVGACAFLLISR